MQEIVTLYLELKKYLKLTFFSNLSSKVDLIDQKKQHKKANLCVLGLA